MTRSIAVLAIVTGLTASSVACITHAPRRTFDAVNKVSMPNYCSNKTGYESTSIAGLQSSTPAGEAERTRVGCVSEEEHLASPATPNSLPHDPFYVHVFEFDDDGVPWNPAQQAASFEALQRQLAEPAVVVAFVHGWKNDASVCNGNLTCFREMLQILAKGEKAFDANHPRRVIGVYIGWRGGTVKGEGINAVSFWGRKHTAHVIGDNGGVTAVIERLRTIVDNVRTVQANERKSQPGSRRADTSLIFVGHSFGGALLFSALGTSLNARVGAAIQNVAAQERAGKQWPRARGHCPRPDPAEQILEITQQRIEAGRRQAIPSAAQALPETTRPVISKYKACIETTGDLVILVNPAMEASRFANLAYTRNLEFDEEQVPIFMTLASEADWAVGGFFPVGQAFGTISRAARSRDVWFRMEKGFGLYEPYHTHRLIAMRDTDAVKAPRPTSSSAPCRCTSNIKSIGDELIRRLQPLYDLIHELDMPATQDNALMRSQALQNLRLAAYQEMLFSRLEPIRDVDPNNPFVMATIDSKVVNGHSDIFNARFMEFLIEYIIRTELKRGITEAYRGSERAR